MHGAVVGLALAASVVMACSSDGAGELRAFEVGDGARLVSNDEVVDSYDEWLARLHFALPGVEVPRGLALVNAYSYRPDADLDLSLVSLFFEDAEDSERWLLVKFDDRAPFTVLAQEVAAVDLGQVMGRGGVYTNGGGERWREVVFEACRLGVTVKGGAAAWSSEDIAAVARTIVEGCDDPRGPVGD
jgi:hypothetical protein